MDLCELEASLVYIMSYRPARVTQSDLVSNKHKTNLSKLLTPPSKFKSKVSNAPAKGPSAGSKRLESIPSACAQKAHAQTNDLPFQLRTPFCTTIPHF